MTKVRVLTVLILLVASTALVGLTAGQAAERDADLHIEQPHYVNSDVEVDTSGNYTTYRVTGPEHQIAPQNFNDENVIDYGVEEDSASLSVNQELGNYVFDASADGTYHVYFVVQTESEREVEVEEGNETVTETENVTQRERYVAQINVEDTNQQLVPGGELEDMHESATNWNEWVSAVQAIAGEDADIQRQTQLALDGLNVRHNPTVLVTGEFWYIGFVLFGTFSGLSYVAIWLFWDWKKNREMAKKVNEVEAMEVEEADLDEKLMEFEREDRNRVLVNTNAYDWCDDEYAARGFTKSFGEDNLTSYLRFSSVLSGGNILHDRLLAMGKEGYWAAATRDEEDGLLEARILPPTTGDDELRDGEERIDLAENAEELSEVIDPMEDEVFNFDLSDADVNARELGSELENAEDIDELVEQMDADMNRFQGSEEAYVKYLNEFVSHVRDHPFTDKTGRPKTNRYVLSMFLKKAQVYRDIFNMPLSKYQAEYLEKLLKEHDPVEDAEVVVDQDRRGVDINAD